MFDAGAKFSDAKGVFSYIESFINLERGAYRPRQYRLERMQRLLSVFGNPHRDFDIVHVAGSKGKGSTATFISSIMAEAGHDVGLYMSPHVSDYKERITRAGTYLEDEVFVAEAERIAAYISRLHESGLPPAEYPTTFELLTLLSFLVFRTIGFRWIVVETGIGGRLDATNVVSPRASVITPIELEHTEYLGRTIEEVAAEKAGIIKEGVPVFVGRLAPQPLEVMRTVAAGKKSPIFELPEQIREIRATVTAEGTNASVRWQSGDTTHLTLSLLGRAQVDNACLAALVCRRMLPDLPERVIVEGLASARLPGRMEVTPGRPTVVLDGAHTPDSVRTSLAAFQEAFGRSGTLVFGSVEGKKHREMAQILGPAFSRVIVTTPGTFKSSNPEGVADAFRPVSDRVDLVLDPARAIQAARKGTEAVLVTGSFYLAGAVRNILMYDGDDTNRAATGV